MPKKPKSVNSNQNNRDKRGKLCFLLHIFLNASNFIKESINAIINLMLNGCFLVQDIQKCHESLDDDKKGKFYCVYFDEEILG